MQTIYQQKGFNTRREYLESLADDYGLPESLVFDMASMLGEIEDFDGLVSMLQDIDPSEFE